MCENALYGKPEKEAVSCKPYSCNPFDLLNLISKQYAYQILTECDGYFYSKFTVSKKGKKYIGDIYLPFSDDIPEDAMFCRIKIDGLYVIMNYLAMSKNTLIDAQMINRLMLRIPHIAIVNLLEDMLKNYRSFTGYVKADKAVLFEDPRVCALQKCLNLSNNEVFDTIDRLILMKEKFDNNALEDYLNLFTVDE